MSGPFNSSPWIRGPINAGDLAGLTLVAASGAPATPTSTGTAGNYFADGNYFYLCVATNTWVRAAVMDWS